MSSKLLRILFIFVIFGLFLYSFTQVDLSLTFVKIPTINSILQKFQYIGYFQRPLSTYIYLSLIVLLFAFYLSFIRSSLQNKINRKQIWTIIFITAGILTFSYNAFSYDLFNNIFDAKIFTHYHLNPYSYKALDFPNDPMLSFMHWTHRTYPYGPLWLGITIPWSFLGANIFILTFYLFKLVGSAFYIGTVYLIDKINRERFKKTENFGLIFFALNPLVIIEVLVSSHNDIEMIFFAILGIFLFLRKRFLLGVLSIIAAALVKQVMVFLLAPFLFYLFQEKILKKKLISFNQFLIACIVFAVIGFSYILTLLEVQPWYFIWILPFFALIRPNKYISSILIGASMGLLLRYAPFLYKGDWNGYVSDIKTYVTFLTPAFFILVLFLARLLKRPEKVR